MQVARLYDKLSVGLVRCLACAWKCTIPADQTGICGVRANQKGQLYLTVYGKAVGIHLDPVEKKPLFHFMPGSTALSFGTIGCCFGCRFCQNWHMSQPSRQLRQQKLASQTKLRKLQKIIADQSENWPPEKIVNYAIQIGAASIAYTYNEPTIFIEYAYDTARLTHQKGLKNIFVSDGYLSEEALNYITPYLDAINIDLKSFNPDFYQHICQAKLQPVLDNIKRVHSRKIHLEITTLIIPRLNDNKKELTQIAKFIYDVSPNIPWHVTAFCPNYKMQNIPPTPTETIIQAYQIGKKVGLKYVYTGNISDYQHASTFCPKCNNLLIKRVGYDTLIQPLLNLNNGKCRKCQTEIYGVWKE